MKKEFGFFLLSLFSLNFVSAYSFTSFTFGNLFSIFNVSMYLTALLFATIFAVIYFIVGKTPFGENRGVRWIIALCAASFSLWGIVSSGFSFEDFLYRFGISGSMLSTILWMIAVIIALILIAKLKFRNFLAVVFFILGATLLALSLFGVLYEQAGGIIIGGIFLLLALIIHKRKPKDKISYQEKWYKKLLKKKDKNTPNSNLGGSIPNSSAIQMQQKRRSIYDLKQKYIAYGNRFNQISRNNPQEARRTLQAMDVITKMARRQGVSEREFLSNKYIMNYKSVNEIRRKAGY